MNVNTAYIVPAWSDQAGQCRIIAAEGKIADPRSSHSKFPKLWHEVGLINSAGRLVCLTDQGNLRDELESCVPLAAGLVFYFNP